MMSQYAGSVKKLGTMIVQQESFSYLFNTLMLIKRHHSRTTCTRCSAPFIRIQKRRRKKNAAILVMLCKSRPNAKCQGAKRRTAIFIRCTHKIYGYKKYRRNPTWSFQKFFFWKGAFWTTLRCSGLFGSLCSALYFLNGLFRNIFFGSALFYHGLLFGSQQQNLGLDPLADKAMQKVCQRLQRKSSL